MGKVRGGADRRRSDPDLAVSGSSGQSRPAHLVMLKIIRWVAGRRYWYPYAFNTGDAASLRLGRSLGRSQPLG